MRTVYFYKSHFILLLVLIAAMAVACKQDKAIPSTDQITILLPQDPERINPGYDARSIGREVFQYIHLPLGDFDPESLELVPICIEEIPTIQQDDQGNPFFQIKIKEEAKWNDGVSMTAEDYIFTIKSVLLPETIPKSWKSVLPNITKMVPDPNNKKILDVYVKPDYMLDKELVSTLYLLPKHTYAHTDVLDNYTLDEIQSLSSENTKDSLSAFLKDFNDPKNFGPETLGNGPYELIEWETDQFIKLQAVDSFWGSGSDNPYLMANIPKIEFKIISDEMTALTAFKDGGVDLMKGLTAINFEKLKEEFPEGSYLVAPSTRYLYVCINNQNPILKDKAIRKALAQMVDVKSMIDNLQSGYGIQLTGPIHPNANHYNDSLDSDIFDPKEAAEGLSEAGWEDTNDNDILDKLIDGKLNELELDLLITGGGLGEKVALMIQSEAKKHGVKINIVPKDIRRMRAENIYTYNYDLAALAEGQDIAPMDPSTRWHSSNVVERGTNLSGFQSEEADRLIEIIRTTKDEEERLKTYKEFHQLIYEEQPVIFMFSPSQRLAVGPNFDASVTPKRPGYLANTFQIKAK